MKSDTSSDARQAQLAILRALGSDGRLRLAAEMSEDVRRIAIDAERNRHPELGEEEARRAVIARLLARGR